MPCLSICTLSHPLMHECTCIYSKTIRSGTLEMKKEGQRYREANQPVTLRCAYLYPWVQVHQRHHNTNVHDIEKEEQNSFIYVHLHRCVRGVGEGEGTVYALSGRSREDQWLQFMTDSSRCCCHLLCHQLPLPQPLPPQ